MSEWKKVKLGDYIDVLSGFAYKSKDFSDSGIPVIKIKNVCPPYISLEDLSYVPNSIAFQNPRYILKKGDVLIAMTGSHINQIASVVGRVGRVRYDDVTVLNQRVGKIVNKDDSLSCLDFIYYYLSQYEVKVELAQKAGGAANQANISPSDIKNLMIPCPPLEVQNRIATILSRYDSLIENYQKQIKLLEEAAQRLYKEWFVDLHFPDHENTKIVDGVPEGWEKKTLDEYCSVFTGKKNANAAVPLGKYKFFTCGETPLQINSFIYDGPAIIISGNGSYTGRTTFYEGKFDLYQRTYACTISNNDNKDMIYGLFEIVKCELTAQISGGTHGAAIPYIVMGDVTKFTFTSNDIILRKFSKIIKSFLDRTMCISSQIRLLTEARDRLLPKLMNGEIIT